MKNIIVIIYGMLLSINLFANENIGGSAKVAIESFSESELVAYQTCLHFHQQKKNRAESISLSTGGITINYSNKGEGKFLCSNNNYKIIDGRLSSAKSDLNIFAFEGSNPVKIALLRKSNGQWKVEGNIENIAVWLGDFKSNK